MLVELINYMDGLVDANPTLDQLQTFIVVAEAGGFSAASRRMNRAQSVVSYTIANLELQLNLKLFERRGTRKPTLTAAGLAVLEDARRITSGLNTLRQRVDGLTRGVEARIALGIDELVPMPVVTSVIKKFHEEFPTVSLRLSAGVLGFIGNAVRGRDIDVGIAGGSAINGTDLSSRRVGHGHIIPVAAPNHPLAKSSHQITEGMLREHFQIVVSDHTSREDTPDFNIHAFSTWQVANSSTKQALILSGLGWGGLPGWMVEDDLAARRLVKLRLEAYRRSAYFLFAISVAGMSFGPATSWVVDCFQREIKAFQKRRAI